MNESLWTFVFEIANFVALAAVLAWLFFKPVRKALEAQQAKARRLEEDATQKLAQAESLRQENESRRQALTSELEAMRIKVREATEQEAEQRLAEARTQIARERATFRREALHIEQAQTSKIAKVVAAVTHDTMQRFLHQLDGPELEQALIAAACRELQTFSGNMLAPVTVETAMELGEESLELIKASLGKAAKTAVFRVVPRLTGGLRISTAHGLIDASVTGLADFAEQSLAAEMESIIREESESEEPHAYR